MKDSIADRKVLTAIPERRSVVPPVPGPSLESEITRYMVARAAIKAKAWVPSVPSPSTMETAAPRAAPEDMPSM